MNGHINGKSREAKRSQLSANHHLYPKWSDERAMFPAHNYPSFYAPSLVENEWEAQEASHYHYPSMASASDSENSLPNRRLLKNISITARKTVPVAQYLAPIAFRTLLTPKAKATFNPLTAQLLIPILQKGERYSRQKEAAYFRLQETEIEVAQTAIARDAALTEVLAAEASHTNSESEAATLIGTTIPITLSIMEVEQLLSPVLPILLVITARLVRFLHRHSRASRRLLRLIPTIIRSSVASLQAALRWGCYLDSALISCIMAAVSKRILSKPHLVSLSLTRNALIRFSTVARS